MRNGELGGIFYRWEWYISTPIFALPQTHTCPQSRVLSSNLDLTLWHPDKHNCTTWPKTPVEWWNEHLKTRMQTMDNKGFTREHTNLHATHFIINIDIAICMPCHKEAFCIWHPCNCIATAAPPTRFLISLLSWYEVRFIRICKHANTLVQTDLTELDYVLSRKVNRKPDNLVGWKKPWH